MQRKILKKSDAASMSEAGLVGAWVNRYKLEILRPGGEKYGFNGNLVLKALAGQWLLVRSPKAKHKLSPKAPQFAMNLAGTSLEATIDVWAARYLRRTLTQGTAQWRIQAKSESAVQNPDFALGQLVFGRAAQKLGMKPDDLQALMWFSEKDFYDQKGWAGDVGAFKGSFDDAAEAFFPSPKAGVPQAPNTLRRGSNIIEFLQKERGVAKRMSQLSAIPAKDPAAIKAKKKDLKDARKALTKARTKSGVRDFIGGR